MAWNTAYYDAMPYQGKIDTPTRAKAVETTQDYNKRRRHPQEVIDQVVAMRKEGYSYRQLEKEFSVSRRTIEKWCK